MRQPKTCRDLVRLRFKLPAYFLLLLMLIIESCSVKQVPHQVAPKTPATTDPAFNLPHPPGPALPPPTSPAGTVSAGPDLGTLGITLPSKFLLVEGGAFSAQKSLRALDKDLAKVKNMGVGWVRMGIEWYSMVDWNTNAIAPDRREFLKAAVQAAKVRGIRILFQIVPTAPVTMYSCIPVAVQPSVADGVSGRLDFCTDRYKKFVGDLIDIVGFHVQHFELSNEVNWAPSPHLNVSSKAQLWTDTYYAWGPFYMQERMKELYQATKEVMAAKATGTFQPRLLSSGLSYGYDSVTHGPETPADLLQATGPEAIPRYVTEAREFLTGLATGWQPGPAGHNTYRDDLDIIAVHPYREPDFIAGTLQILSATWQLTTVPSGSRRSTFTASDTSVGERQW